MYRVLYFVCLGVLLTGSTIAGQDQAIPPFKDSLEIHQTDTVYFPFAAHTIPPEEYHKITRLAANRPRQLQLYIEGHTDAVGSNDANEALAERRALAAQTALIEAGWPKADIQRYHFGERHLAIPTQQKEARNRRVLLRSGLPQRYVRIEGIIRGPDGQPLPGGALAHGTHLRDTTTADETGRFHLLVPLDDSIRLDLFARRHFIDTRRLIVRGGDPPPPPLDVRLQEAVPGKHLEIKDLYFVGNTTQLLPGGTAALESAYHFMDYNRDIRIELAGHVNNSRGPQRPGTWSYNLAGARAKLVYNYLVRRGIDPRRMRYKSYSNFEQVYPKAEGEAQMRQNRRVEIRILE